MAVPRLPGSIAVVNVEPSEAMYLYPHVTIATDRFPGSGTRTVVDPVTRNRHRHSRRFAPTRG
jgi:hypothetical protein